MSGFCHATQAVRQETVYHFKTLEPGSLLHGLLMPLAQKTFLEKLLKLYKVSPSNKISLLQLW
jgi:hypothetical protein